MVLRQSDKMYKSTPNYEEESENKFSLSTVVNAVYEKKKNKIK